MKKVGVYGHTFLQASAQIPYKFVDGHRIFVHCVYEAAYGYEREFSSVRPRLILRGFGRLRSDALTCQGILVCMEIQLNRDSIPGWG